MAVAGMEGMAVAGTAVGMAAAGTVVVAVLVAVTAVAVGMVCPCKRAAATHPQQTVATAAHSLEQW